MVIERARDLARSGRPWFCLDSDDGSYVGVASEIRVAERGREREFLAALRQDLNPSKPADGRFRSGWVVALGYEFGVALMGIDPEPDSAPPGFALRVDDVREVGDSDGEPPLDTPSASDQHLRHSDALTVDAPSWRTAPTAYEANVEACLAAIDRGDAYVLCLTDSASATGDLDPLALFERLRERGPALRGGAIVAGDRALVSASPERFLSVRAAPGGDAVVRTHPIKGTRRRSADPEADAELAAELARDPKERAENLMIVDLMRNDLSRICVPGTVGVDGFLRVESHTHVHQLVSTVFGTLADGRDVFDALDACFPGGSMTGAPKRSAVEILAALENGPRGLYSGCFGWIDDSGDAELAMTIRSVELRGLGGPSVTALVGAGGGVTADSDPERERIEKDLKAAALLDALSH